jgi:hypothetical protein
MTEPIGADGVVRFRRVRAKDAHAFWAWLPRGLYALDRDAGAGEGERVVRLLPGRTIRGRLRAPAGATGLGASAESEFVRGFAAADASGDYEIRGLPDGTYTVTASGILGRQSLLATRRVESGGTADFELVPPPPK